MDQDPVARYFEELGVDEVGAKRAAVQIAAAVADNKLMAAQVPPPDPDWERRQRLEELLRKLTETLHDLTSLESVRLDLSVAGQRSGIPFHEDKQTMIEILPRMAFVTRVAMNDLPEEKPGRGRPKNVPRDRFELHHHYQLLEIFREATGRLPARDHGGRHPEFDALLSLIGEGSAPLITRKAIEKLREVR